MSQVKVTSNDQGQIVVPSQNNPEYGYIRVESKTTAMVNGWANTQTRTALIKGTVEALNSFVEERQLRAGSVLEGKILVKETLEKPYDNAQAKRAGAEGAILKKDGQPIYRTSEYTTNVDEQDVLIKHDTITQHVPGVIQPNTNIRVS
jgi:hypothetical protein